MTKGPIQEENIKIVNIYPPNIKVKEKSLSCVLLFAIPWTVAHQAPLSMGFSRQEYWSGLPFPMPEDLSNPRIKHISLMSPALEGRFFATSVSWESA